MNITCTFTKWITLAMKRGNFQNTKEKAEANRRARFGLWRMESNAWNLQHGLKRR